MPVFAACVVLIHRDGSVLGVSRRWRPDDIGLPGGKLSDGEDARVAASRELLEETSVTVDPDSLRLLYVGHDGNCDVATFMADRWSGEPKSVEPGVDVSWVEWDVLLSGSFGEYNGRVFEAVERQMGPNY